jgi:D-alanyl-D-alanine carboxypeptidase (penicillin-binding protein 5/6)
MLNYPKRIFGGFSMINQHARGLILSAMTLLTTTMAWAAGAPSAASVFENDHSGKVVGSSALPSVSNASPMQKAAMVTPTPVPPTLSASAYILEEVTTGQVLGAQNPDQRVAPASLTKLMTLYLTFEALQSGRIHMTDIVPVSVNAWKTGGSRMFIKPSDQVTVADLINGVIVDSGNDACVALAEYIGGTEAGFVNLMNQQAKLLEMKNTHYQDCNGLPDPGHYSTARDLSLLARAIILNFPQYYPLFSQKTFTYNKITQPNRNRLLFHDPLVDGLKTGHTDEAGFCLIASAKNNNLRLLTVLLGAPTDAARAEYSEQLLNYGFHSYELHKVYTANQPIEQSAVYFGKTNLVPVGVAEDFNVITFAGKFDQVKMEMNITSPLKAPLARGQKVGEIHATLEGKEIGAAQIVALDNVPKASIFGRMWDHVRLMASKKA